MACPYCFGPRHDLKAEVAGFLGLIPLLAERGTRSVVITGGEPLLVRRLPALLKIATECGLSVVLSTNGSLLPRRHAEILPHVDWLALPIDSPNPFEQGMLRPAVGEVFRPDGDRHLRNVVLGMRLTREQYPHVRVKLGTVITRVNSQSVPAIPGFLDSQGLRPDVWKLYRVIRSSYAKDVWASLSIGDQEYGLCLEASQLEARRHDWHVATLDEDSRNMAYLFCEPDGSAMAVRNGKEVVIGNFFNGFEGVVSSWENYVDESQLHRNFDRTYPASLT